MKECSVCGEIGLSLIEFKLKQSICKKCRHPLGHLTPRQRALNSIYKKKYNMTYDQYIIMADDQNHLCAICKKLKKLVVDHNHKTGKVRGLLCTQCNAGIGMLHEATNILQNAIEYLNFPKEVLPDPGIPSAQKEIFYSKFAPIKIAELEYEISNLNNKLKEKGNRLRALHAERGLINLRTFRAVANSFKQLIESSPRRFSEEIKNKTIKWTDSLLQEISETENKIKHEVDRSNEESPTNVPLQA